VRSEIRRKKEREKGKGRKRRTLRTAEIFGEGVKSGWYSIIE